MTAPTTESRYVIRGPLGYYAGPATRYRLSDRVRWQPKPNPCWLFGSEAAALRRIRQRGFGPEVRPEVYVPAEGREGA